MSRNASAVPPLDPDDLAEVLEATAPLWPELDGTSLFVTGGSGFFGTWMLESLLAARNIHRLNVHIVVLTRDPEKFKARAPHVVSHSAVRLLKGDVRSFSFPDGEFRYVLHGATEASAALNDASPLEMFDTVVSGTRRVLDFAAGAGTRRFLLTSSGAVYGRQPDSIANVSEAFAQAPDPTKPSSAYGEGKRAAELLGAIYANRHRSLEFVIARCFAFVGPHLPLDRHFAIGNFIGDALAGRTIHIRGDGTPLRSYLYASELAVWLWTILIRGRSLVPYNVGSDRAVSIADTARAVAAAVEPPVGLEIAQRAVSGRAPERYVPDTSLARSELGLSQHVSLEEAIRRTIRWHRGA